LAVKSGEAQNVHLAEDNILTLTNAAFVGKPTETATISVREASQYVLATLTGGKTDQCSLDLTFFPGNQLSFGVDGQGEVHLVGSLQSYNNETGSDSEEEADAAELAHRGGISQKPFGKSALHDLEAEESADGSLELSGDFDEEDDGDEEDESLSLAPKKPTLLPTGKDKKPADATATPSKKDDKKAAATSKPAAAAAAQTPKGAVVGAAAGASVKGAESGKKKPSAALATPKTTPAAAAPTPKRPASTPGELDAPAGKKAKPDTPKSAGGGIKCDQCSKSLPNQQALEQHTKAKHAAK